MASGKSVLAPEYPANDSIDKIMGRVKKDMLWVLVSVAVAIIAGLAAGQLF